MAARRDVKFYIQLREALRYRAVHPRAKYYKGQSYKGFYLPWAKRLLPTSYQRLKFHGHSKFSNLPKEEFTDIEEEDVHFILSVDHGFESDPALKLFLDEGQAPLESAKRLEKIDQDKIQDTLASAREIEKETKEKVGSDTVDKQPEPVAEPKKSDQESNKTEPVTLKETSAKPLTEEEEIQVQKDIVIDLANVQRAIQTVQENQQIASLEQPASLPVPLKPIRTETPEKSETAEAASDWLKQNPPQPEGAKPTQPPKESLGKPSQQIQTPTQILPPPQPSPLQGEPQIQGKFPIATLEPPQPLVKPSEAEVRGNLTRVQTESPEVRENRQILKGSPQPAATNRAPLVPNPPPGPESTPLAQAEMPKPRLGISPAGVSPIGGQSVKIKPTPPPNLAGPENTPKLTFVPGKAQGSGSGKAVSEEKLEISQLPYVSGKYGGTGAGTAVSGNELFTKPVYISGQSGGTGAGSAVSDGGIVLDKEPLIGLPSLPRGMGAPVQSLAKNIASKLSIALGKGAGGAGGLLGQLAAGASTGGIGTIALFLLSHRKEIISAFKWGALLLLGLILIMPSFLDLLRNTPLLPAEDQKTGPACYGGTIGNGVCPTQLQINNNRDAGPNNCKYFNPPINIFGDMDDQQQEAYIQKYYPEAKARGRNYEESAFRGMVGELVQASRKKGINPFMALAYWRSESGFGGSLGCNPENKAQINDFAAQIQCKMNSHVVNCAVSKDASSPACKLLSDIRKAHPTIYNSSIPGTTIEFPIKTFDEFAEAYGSRSPRLVDYEGPRLGVTVNNNCVATYNTLLEVASTVNACQGGSTTQATNSQNTQELTYSPVNSNVLAATTSDDACTFYRSGDQTTTQADGRQFKVQEWPNLISDVASKVGVPAAALAGILRVECGDCFSTSNPEYVTNDYDNHHNGLPAVGVMQFTIPTFQSTFDLNKEDIQAKFGKTAIDTSYLTPQNQMKGASAFRIYSIKDSVIAAAYKIKKDAGSSPPYDRAAIERIVKAYFTQCTYTQGGKTFNYCDDLEKSINGCTSGQLGSTNSGQIPASQCSCTQSKPGSGGAQASCPVPGGKITTGSYSGKLGTSQHCNAASGYGAGACRQDCPGGVGASRRAKAIDIDTRGGKTVQLPTVNGQQANWTLLKKNYNDNYGGNGQTFTAQVGSDNWYLDFIHMQAISQELGKSYPSGTVLGGTVIDHVHVTMGKNLNGGPSSVSPGTPATDCDAGWLASDFMCDGSGGTRDIQNSVSSQNNSGGGQVVILDPGHCASGKWDNKASENALNRSTAQALSSLLSANGFQPKITDSSGSCPQDGYYANLQSRVDFANQNNGAVYVSIHADSGAQRDQFSSLYSAAGPLSAESRQLGNSITQAIAKQVSDAGRKVSPIQEESTKAGTDPGLEFYVLGPQGAQTAAAYGDSSVPNILRQRNMPGIIVENYMKTNPDYSNLNQYTNAIAQGYCDGISQFLVGKPCNNKAGNNNSASTCQNNPGNTSNTFFCQKDPKWSQQPANAGSGCTLGYAGCGPTTTAMILARFNDTTIPNSETWPSSGTGKKAEIPALVRGKEVNPANIDAIFINNRWRLPNEPCGSTMPPVTEWLKSIGYEVVPLAAGGGGALNASEIDQYIKNGYLILASQGNWHYAKIDHIFGISEVKDGNFTVFDPANCKADGSEGPQTSMKNDPALQWKYAYAIKKK
jgi:N-acetylmuramoyl-L-alanine amidase